VSVSRSEQKAHAADFATLTKQVRERMLAQKKRPSEGTALENTTPKRHDDAT
jgi:hypothetical protein